jgi:hypothetical protein
MPNILRVGPYRFFIYSNEGDEPPHVHVRRDRKLAKFWLSPSPWPPGGASRGGRCAGSDGSSPGTGDFSWRLGMSTSPHSADPRARTVEIDDDEIRVDLVDGRRVCVPLTWFPRLLHARQADRENWELLGDGEGIHWPSLDEDLSVAGLLRGTPAPDAGREAPATETP